MADQITDEDRSNFEPAFKSFDKDEDGIIDKEELATVMRFLNQPVTDEEVDSYIKQYAGDESSGISLDQFVVMMKKVKEENGDGKTQLLEAFKVFDSDNDGKITVEELKTALFGYGSEINEEEAQEMIDMVDKNGDGCVDINEFTDLMTGM